MVQQLAESLGVSERTVHYAFKDCTGTPPYQFILLRRLHHVRKHNQVRQGKQTYCAPEVGW